MPRPPDIVANLHMEIETLLDRHRISGVPEAKIIEALERTLRSSVVIKLAGDKLGGWSHRKPAEG